VEMVGEAVSPLWFLVFGISHQQSLLPDTPGWTAADTPNGPIGRTRAGGSLAGSPARGGRSAKPFNMIAPTPGAQTVRFPPGPACLGVSLGVSWNTIIIYRTFI